MGQEIIHDRAGSRYVLKVDGAEAGFADYSPKETIAHELPEVRDFNHTYIHPSFRGHGLSEDLIRYALDDTRASGAKVIATCSAVAGFIGKNPEYADLLAGRRRPRPSHA